MIPGPTAVVACPHCGCWTSHPTAISCNTCGASVWSDGKRFHPMMPRVPEVVCCIKCKDLYWMKDAVPVEEHPPLAFDFDWNGRPVENEKGLALLPGAEPAEEDFYRALEAGFAEDEKQESRLRLLALWRRNDEYREERPKWGAPRNSIGLRAGAYPKRKLVLTKASRANMLRLLDLSPGPEEESCLLRAEFLRTMGRFAEARKVLTAGKFDRLAEVAKLMAVWCDHGERRVMEVSDFIRRNRIAFIPRFETEKLEGRPEGSDG